MLDEMKEQQRGRIPFERQLAMCDEADMSKLQTFNYQVAEEIVRLSDAQPGVKKMKVFSPENFNCDANFAFEHQEEELLQETNKY